MFACFAVWCLHVLRVIQQIAIQSHFLLFCAAFVGGSLVAMLTRDKREFWWTRQRWQELGSERLLAEAAGASKDKAGS